MPLGAVGSPTNQLPPTTRLDFEAFLRAESRATGVGG
jgi:hypothetical protein